MYLSALLDPSVTHAWKEGKLHTVIFSADWMMHLSLVLPTSDGQWKIVSYGETQNGLGDGS